MCEYGDDPSKANCVDCHTDCTPMLIKREALDECSLATEGTPCSRRQYACSWPRNRPLPTPSNNTARSPGTPHDAELMGELEMDGVLLSPELHPPSSPSHGGDFRTLPLRDVQTVPAMCPNGTIYSVSSRPEGVIPSVFTTFKPVRTGSQGAGHGQDVPSNVYFVEGVRRKEDGPYYFKFDAGSNRGGIMPHEHAHAHAHAHKPDVVQGCAICQANLNAANTQVSDT